MAEPLDSSILKEVASDALDGAKIVSFRTEPAVAVGEHYLSTLLRVYVTFRRPGEDSDSETRLIIKSHPQGVLSEFVKASSMFVKELESYNKILPRINELNGRNITPIRLGSIREDVLVLEDLKPKGFQTTNRVDKLDFEHAREALKLLADFHAASIKVHEKNSKLYDEIKVETLYTDNNLYNRTFNLMNFKLISDEFESIPHLKMYSDRLRQAGEKTWNAVQEAVKPRQDQINAFCHGDFWTTNILYSYDKEGKIKETRFVDFQFCRWGPPALDLTMLYMTSLRDLEQIPKLTSIYLERLNTHLHPNVLTPEELEKEMRRLDCLGFMLSVCTLPICTLDPKNPLNFGDTTPEDFNNAFPEDRPNPYLIGLRDEGYLKIIPKYLEFYDKMGLF